MQSKTSNLSSSRKLLTSSGANLQTPSMQDTTKPKGFPTTGSKRLQPIKATALKNAEMTTSPSLNSDCNLDIKKTEQMMRMT